METPQIKQGDTVTTVHGEELTVLDVKVVPVNKQGAPTGKMEVMVLAESGDSKCWFPAMKLKRKGKKN